MPSQPNDIEPIYSEALTKANEVDRVAYLDSVCAGNPTLRTRVEALLTAHSRAGRFLETPPPFVEATPLDDTVTEGFGTVIGCYRLLENIGEGGMAVVYMAEQEEPIRRKVALKIIKLGMDTKQVIARFEAERQALAIMDHPSIAKVLDAGATETGRPYFVMELVQGVSITEYCDQNSLNTKERLTLFVQVCNAIHHAHQKGIIHRDVKPSNVMVTMHDGEPVPKIIDFGIAKATNQRLTEKTLFTRYAHIIGTPAYMSPEQAELSDVDIDTRSDIYSLGVLLYELLTGTTPFSEKDLRKAGYLEMQRIIREKEPTKPSTKLSSLGVTLTEVARRRKATPATLRKLVGGDLDWIVMKSLEKARSRRYDTASALAMDVRRHLDHEPVLARAPKAIYCLRKFVFRHRTQIAVVLALVILIGSVATTLSTREKNRLQFAETESLIHRSALSDAREAHGRRDFATALKHLESILDSEHVGPKARLLYAGILVDDHRHEEAAGELANLVNERPEIAGAAYSLWARMLWESESLDPGTLEAVEDCRQKAEQLLPKTAEAYFLRAMTALTIREKLELLNKALDLDRSHHESLRLRAFTHYASRGYESMEGDAYALTVRKPEDPLGYSLRATALRELGRYEEAIADYDKAIGLATEEGPEGAKLRDQRCETLIRMEEYERALADAEEGLRLFPDEASLHFRAFCALTALGRYNGARASFLQITDSGADSVRRFRAWATKYVSDALEAGKPWYPPDREPQGGAFLAMMEAEQTYRDLSAKASRLITDGFGASWSPDGRKLAFSLGVPGNSGLATFDLTSQETRLLVVPGKDPKWSPDGRHIAFVRDCQVLPLPELTAAERRSRYRPLRQEEIWIVRADGAEPRRLARGSWPSWSHDSKRVYFQSWEDARAWEDGMLCSIPIEDGEAVPKPILTCQAQPSVSPNDAYVAYWEKQSLRIVDLDSKSLHSDWAGPLRVWGANWAPDGHEISLGGVDDPEVRTGLWIYDLGTRQAAKVLSGQITAASWASDGSELTFSLGAPFFEIWIADLDPNISTIESLSPGRTPEQHCQEMVELYTDRVTADPEDAESYLHRAQYHHYLHDQKRLFDDMRRYVAILNSSLGTDSHYSWVWNFLVGLWRTAPIGLGSTVNSAYLDAAPSISPDSLELYFVSDRPEGYGGGDIWLTTRASTGDSWGTPVNLGEPVNSSFMDGGVSLSADGLSLCFASNRPGGSGSQDLWMSRRATPGDDWGVPENLGTTVNDSSFDWGPSVSTDGLSLFFDSTRPGGLGSADIWVTTRETLDEDWGAPVNLGSPVNSSSGDGAVSISADGLALFLISDRPRGYGLHAISVTTRPTKNGAWNTPVNLGPTVNGLTREGSPAISADGLELYFDDFATARPDTVGGCDLWQVKIAPMLGPSP